MSEKQAQYCNFCGKSDLEVKKLFRGPAAAVCDECVDLIHQVAHDADMAAQTAAAALNTMFEGTDAPTRLPQKPDYARGLKDMLDVCIDVCNAVKQHAEEHINAGDQGYNGQLEGADVCIAELDTAVYELWCKYGNNMGILYEIWRATDQDAFVIDVRLTLEAALQSVKTLLPGTGSLGIRYPDGNWHIWDEEDAIDNATNGSGSTGEPH